MPNTITIVNQSDKEAVGNLQYGTYLTDAPNNPACAYIKVNKRKLGNDLHVAFPREHCVLLNLKTGGLRAIPGDSLVTVLSASIELTRLDRADVQEFKKF